MIETIAVRHGVGGGYDPETKEKVADSPNGMPYHFDFSSGVDKQEFYDNSDSQRPNSKELGL